MKSYLLDLSERVLFTYIEAFFGLLLANAANITDLGVLKSAAVAAIPAALAVFKGAVAKYYGDTSTAGFLNL